MTLDRRVIHRRVDGACDLSHNRGDRLASTRAVTGEVRGDTEPDKPRDNPRLPPANRILEVMPILAHKRAPRCSTSGAREPRPWPGVVG